MTHIAEGHEDCGRSVNVTEVVAANAGVLRRDESIICHHNHQERLYAVDDLGVEYPVARYCLCCDTLTGRP